MRKTVRIISLAILFSIGLSFKASAQNCDSLIVDEAGIFGTMLNEVEKAALRLQNLGAEPRIRTLARSRGLDFTERDLESSCLSWQSVDGGRKNNLVVMMISVEDREFGFYAGEQWRSALESQYTRIENDHMIPSFRDGDFAKGFIAGLDQVTKLIDAKINQPISPNQPTVIIERQTVPEEPVDFSGLWVVLGWVVGLGALTGLGFLLWQFKLKSEQRRAAQQKAVLAKQATAARVNELSQNLPILESQIKVLADIASKDDVKFLESSFVSIQKLVNPALEAYADLGSMAADPSRKGLTIQEYFQIETSFNERVASPLVEAERLMKSSEATAYKLSELIARIPEFIKEAEEFILTALKGVQTVNNSGYKTEESNQLIKNARDFLRKAERNADEKKFSLAAENINNAKETATTALQTAKNLYSRKSGIESKITEFDKRITITASLIRQGRNVFDKISDEFAESCWESIRGNGTEAEERFGWVKESLSEVRNLADMKNQQWSEAEGLLQEIQNRLDEADSFMRSITALEDNLNCAKKDAPSEIEAAQLDIQKAWAYIQEHDNDIPESYENELRGIETELKEAVLELTNAKPNFLRVVKLAQSANSCADSILAKSRSDHETAERLRQKAASSARDAKAAYSKAKEYIEDHSDDVENSAREFLKLAVTSLKDLENTKNTEKQIKVAEQAEKYADEAYEKAKKNVDDVEEERARRRRAAASRAASSYSSSSRSSSSSGISIGRSSGGFSSGGGFGGSRSFGSSGRGFGGSRKW